MSRASRVLLIVFGLLMVVLLALAIFLVLTVRSPFPQTDGTIILDGLEDEVHVYRDEYGVPHIYASNEDDLTFAQGYVHAQERFWQMEWWRHLGQGRLSEIGGEALVETDKFIRTVGWNRLAEETVAYYEAEIPEAIQALEAYSAGVNAYLAEHGDNFSINRSILNLVNQPWEIEPWEPVDTVSWSIVMGWQLSSNFGEDLELAEMIRELGEARTANLVPLYPYDDRPVIAPTNQMPHADDLLPDDEESRSTPPVDWQRVDTAIVGTEPVVGLAKSAAVGSNNWVVAGEHTASGFPLLANDPHLGIQMPSIWYEMHLHTPDLHVAGFSFAGTPGIVVGHNEHIAWGVTTSRPDVQDLFIERINPNDPSQYEFEGEWLEIEEITEVIHVNGGEDVELTVRLTHHGPIMNEVVDGERDVLALRWTAQDPNRIVQAVLLLRQAENHSDFMEAMRYWDLPSQSFVYADVEGNIAYVMPGRVPNRSSEAVLPVPGWTGEHEWEEYIPFEELPALLNPDEGFIVTANNAVVDEEYPYYLSRYYSSGDRAQRAVEMLEEAIASGDVTAADFVQMQTDSKSLLAASMRPLFDGLSSDDPGVQAAIERLRGWELQTRRDSVPAALFEIFYMQLAENVLADELGAVAEDYLGNRDQVRVFFHDLARQPEATWWDNIETDETESREEIILLSLAETVEWFEDNVGGDMEDWRWGALHQALFVSDPLGQSGIGIVEAIVNRGPYPVDGTNSALNANSWSWDEPADVRGHPSMRMIVDMSDFDLGQGIHTTGQSGHPYHSHYDDFISLWQNGEYHPMWFSREAVEAAAVDHLLLQPPD